MNDIATMKIGDEIRARIYPNVTAGSLTGRVVYIHPKKRFFTLEFTTASGARIRESYAPGGPLDCSEQDEAPRGSGGRRKAA